jgi:hypothetical protein
MCIPVKIVIPTLPSRSKLLDVTMTTIIAQDYPRFKYIIKPETDKSIGEKLNEAIDDAEDGYILRADDDVWNAPDRITRQVDAIGSYAVCGTSIYYSHNFENNETLKINDCVYITYESMMFPKEEWKKRPFHHTSLGECNRFLIERFAGHTFDMRDLSLICSIRHEQNATKKCPPTGLNVKRVLVESLIGMEMFTRYKEASNHG